MLNELFNYTCLITLVHDLYICPGKTVFHGLSFHVHGWKESMTSLSVTVDTEELYHSIIIVCPNRIPLVQ